MEPVSVALVPVRVEPQAKLRLAHLLDAEARRRLVMAMFGHVARVLDDSGLEVVALASGPFETPDGVEVWPDEGAGLNRAVRRAMDRVGGRALVVPADLPWLDAREVERLLTEPGDVVVVPADDGGTNALLVRRPIEPCFGPDSALVHLARSRRAGLAARLLRLVSFAEDLDDGPGLVRALASAPALSEVRIRRRGEPLDGGRQVFPDRATPGPAGPGV